MIPNTYELSDISTQYLYPLAILQKKERMGTLFQFIQKKERKYGKILETARKDYERIMKNYSKDPYGSLTIKSIKDSDFDFYEDFLMAIIRKSNLILFNKNENKSLIIKLNNISDYYFLTTRKANKLYIIGYNSIEKEKYTLGNGSNGIVLKADFISAGIFAALKISIRENNKSLRKEYLNLKYIHKKAPKCGIQAKAYLFDKVNNIKFSSYILNKYYNQNSLRYFLQNTFLKGKKGIEIKYDLAYQLINGLNFLHKNDIIHGDIKLENCFIHDSPKYTIVLGDFGEILLSNKIKDAFASHNPAGTSVTLGYYTPLDHKKLIKAKLVSQNYWLFINKSRDVFALATVLWFLFSGTFPFNFNADGLNIREPLKGNERVRKFLTLDFYLLLKNTLLLPPKKRPSIREFVDLFTKN